MMSVTSPVRRSKERRIPAEARPMRSGCSTRLEIGDSARGAGSPACVVVTEAERVDAAGVKQHENAVRA